MADRLNLEPTDAEARAAAQRLLSFVTEQVGSTAREMPLLYDVHTLVAAAKRTAEPAECVTMIEEVHAPGVAPLTIRTIQVVK